MRILVTGGSGQLGKALGEIAGAGQEDEQRTLIFTDRGEIDLASP